jgi:hypothetical protein
MNREELANKYTDGQKSTPLDMRSWQLMGAYTRIRKGFIAGYDSRQSEIDTLKKQLEASMNVGQGYHREIVALKDRLRKAEEVIIAHSKCDGFCAKDECVCNNKYAIEYLSSRDKLENAN